MRVLVTAPLLPHPGATAGGAVVFYGLIEALAARYEVTLVCFAGASPNDQAGLEALARLAVTTVPVWREPAANVLHRRVRLALRWASGRQPLRVLKFHDPRLQAALDRVVADVAARGDKFDLCQVEDNAMAQYRYPAGVPSVLTEHEVRDGSGHKPLRTGRWTSYQRAVWQRFDRLQVFTERDAAGLRWIAPELAPRVRVNPFGVALGPPPDRAVEGGDELVFVGGFRHAPNVDAARWLAHAIFPLIVARQPGVRLTIVGADPPARVRTLASDRVRVTGFVPDVDPYVERAAVVIAPLRTGGGMRVKLLQAMARGKAVVTTSLGAEGLVTGAPLRVADTAAGLAEAAIALLADPAGRRELGDCARRFVAIHHSWGGFAERLAAIYGELGLPA